MCERKGETVNDNFKSTELTKTTTIYKDSLATWRMRQSYFFDRKIVQTRLANQNIL